MDCQRDPGQKEAWGCETPTQAAVWVDEETDDEYYICPFRFVPQTIIEWYSEYAYYKNFEGTAPTYWDQGDKWIDITSIYSGYFNEMLELIHKQRESKVNTKVTHG